MPISATEPTFGYRYVFTPANTPQKYLTNCVVMDHIPSTASAVKLAGGSLSMIGYNKNTFVIQSPNRHDAKLRRVLTNMGFSVSAADRKPNIDITA
jgi:hypothetical protein